MGNKIDKTTRQQRGQHNAQCGEGDTLPEHGAYLGKFGIHTAREQDDTERDSTDKLSSAGRVELNTQTVGAEEHSDSQEEQQHRRTEAVADLACQDADKEENCPDKKYVFRCKCHICYLYLTYCATNW